MSANKCPHCGLVNFANLENCKRCRAVLDSSQPQQSARRQQVGAWRDRTWLVKHLGVPFDDTCIKCSGSADVSTPVDVLHQPVSVRTLSAWSFLTHFVGIYVFNRITFTVPLCRHHRSRVDKFSIGLMISGASMCLLGFVSFEMMNSIAPVVVVTLGILVIGAGWIAYLVRTRIVKAWKHQEPYIWLWGVHRDYLKRLPHW